MKAVARLMLAYFTGTRLLLVVTVLGALACVGGTAALLFLPPLVAQYGLPSRFSLAEEWVLDMLPIVGILCVAFGAALLPTMFAWLATSHYADVLPYGRVKLLASAFGTVALVALVASTIASLFYLHTPIPVWVVFQRALPVCLVSYALLYCVLWLIGNSGSIGKLVFGTAGVVATLFVPLRFVAVPTTWLGYLWIACAAFWGAVAAALLLAPRLKVAVGRVRHALSERFDGTSYAGAGREIDFMLGVANPWPLALGQIVPIAIAAYFLGDYRPLAAEAPPNPFLLFMTILSVVQGGLASVAATRGRALWLRAHWTRAQLFARVERAFLSHNAFTLGLLLVALVAVGTYLELPTQTLAFGLVLLLLGTALSTYLGLMVTASIGWTEAALALATMVALMVAAVYTAAPATTPATLVALHATLAAAALVFRAVAARRWASLDWMLCRSERAVRASS